MTFYIDELLLEELKLILSQEALYEKSRIFWAVGLERVPGLVLSLLNTKSNDVNSFLINIKDEFDGVRNHLIKGLIIQGVIIIDDNLVESYQAPTSFIEILKKLEVIGEDFNDQILEKRNIIVYNPSKGKEMLSLFSLFENKCETLPISLKPSNETNEILKEFLFYTSSIKLDLPLINNKIDFDKTKKLSQEIQFGLIEEIGVTLVNGENELKIYEQAQQKNVKKKGGEKKKKEEATGGYDDLVRAHFKKVKPEAKKRLDEYGRMSKFASLFQQDIIFMYQASGEKRMPPYIEVTIGQKSTKNIRISIEALIIAKYDDDIDECFSNLIKKADNDFQWILTYDKLNEIDEIGVFYFDNDRSFFPIRGRMTKVNGQGFPQEEKLNIHHIFCLRKDKTYLNEHNSLRLRAKFDIKKDDKLKDVHYALNYKGIENGKKYLLSGHYVYHHYMQDNFDDKGWGCAYRSLQTVLSWFIEQNIIKPFPIPTHKRIQEILFEMGDKPKELIGSSEWLGAFEVSLVINNLIGIDCKILFLSNGADILSKVRELKNHFIEEETPVMFGGGVFAFTLLGVDYNEVTGNAKFLILDPHYTGSDNIKNIIEKGGISWKGPELFLPNTYYNFCLPLRPKNI